MKRYIKSNKDLKSTMNPSQKRGYEIAAYYSKKYRKAMKELAK